MITTWGSTVAFFLLNRPTDEIDALLGENEFFRPHLPTVQCKFALAWFPPATTVVDAAQWQTGGDHYYGSCLVKVRAMASVRLKLLALGDRFKLRLGRFLL